MIFGRFAQNLRGKNQHFHVRREREGKREFFSRYGVAKGEPCRVEGGPGDERALFDTVQKISNKRVAYVGHVDPDLVSPTSFKV